MWAIGLALGRTHTLGSLLLLGGIFFSLALAIYMPIRGSILKRRLRQKETVFAASMAASSLSLQQGQSPAQGEPLWEYCAIESEGSGNFNEHLYAKAVGPRGTYRVARSRRLGELSSERGREDILNELINELIATGWEPMSMSGGSGYGGYRFRRRVR